MASSASNAHTLLDMSLFKDTERHNIIELRGVSPLVAEVFLAAGLGELFGILPGHARSESALPERIGGRQ